MMAADQTETSSQQGTGAREKPNGFLRGLQVHPLLLSIYVPLFLFAHNFFQVYTREIFLPLILCLLAGTLVFLIMRFALGNWEVSAVFSSTIIFFTFFYGFIVTEENKQFMIALFPWRWIFLAVIALAALLLTSSKHFRSFLKRALLGMLQKKSLLIFLGCAAAAAVIFGLLVSKSLIENFHILPASLWIAFALVSCALLHACIKNYEHINRLLNAVTIVLVLISLGQIAYSAASFRGSIISADGQPSSAVADTSDLPDIYYLIPDEYAGRDTLITMYNFTNDDFLGWLKEKNFYVVEHSLSNYNKTHLSVPSSLNLNFIEELIETSDLQNADTLLEQLAKNNLVVKTLKQNHYTYINIGSRWSLTGKNPNADISYSYEGLSHFNELVIKSTILRAFNSPAQVFHFETLKEIPELEQSPKFVFAHMPVPHVPFIYDKDGNILPAEEWYNFNNYLGQLLFVNRELKEIISAILDKTKRPVVIIVQSDHGFRFCSKVSYPAQDCSKVNGYNNLNAYYFSDGDYSGLYRNITPVNTFRVVFNKYLKTNYSLLPDKSDFTSIQLEHD